MNKKQKVMCPILVLANWIPERGYPNVYCEQEECALWNPHIGCCGLIATGIIQGIEVERREAAARWEADVR